MSGRNSSLSVKSQHSVDSAQEGEVFMAQQNVPTPGDEAYLVQEEDLQSEADCGSNAKRNSVGSVTRVSLSLSRQSSQQQKEQPFVEEPVEEMGEEMVAPATPDIEVEPQQVRIVMEMVDEDEEQSLPVPNVPLESNNNSNGQSRPLSMGALGPKASVEEQKPMDSPSANANVEEKVLAQIRAKKNVASLIAKFSSGTDDGMENGNGKQQKLDSENASGAVNIQAMRQKFSQK